MAKTPIAPGATAQRQLSPQSTVQRPSCLVVVRRTATCGPSGRSRQGGPQPRAQISIRSRKTMVAEELPEVRRKRNTACSVFPPLVDLPVPEVHSLTSEVYPQDFRISTALAADVWGWHLEPGNTGCSAIKVPAGYGGGSARYVNCDQWQVPGACRPQRLAGSGHRGLRCQVSARRRLWALHPDLLAIFLALSACHALLLERSPAKMSQRPRMTAV